MHLVCENGKFRISEFITIPSEKFWKTTLCTSSEEIIERFVQALKYKDLSTIYEMMPYQETAVDDAKAFILLEIENPVLDSFKASKDIASASISFKILTHSTDEMGTTSTASKKHTIQLHMTKTETGWILNEVTQQEAL